MAKKNDGEVSLESADKLLGETVSILRRRGEYDRAFDQLRPGEKSDVVASLARQRKAARST
jgi:hypothetical protein